jgi:hypothetical protein
MEEKGPARFSELRMGGPFQCHQRAELELCAPSSRRAEHL